MDRNMFIGIALMVGILITFNVLNQPSAEEVAQMEQERMIQDSIAQAKLVVDSIATKEIAQVQAEDKLASVPDSLLVGLDSTAKDSVANVYQAQVLAKAKADKLDVFSPSGVGSNTFYTIENDKLRLKISSKSGRVASVYLKEYQSYDDYMVAKKQAGDKGDVNIIKPLQLFDADSSSQYVGFSLSNGKKIQTNDLYFTPTSVSKDKIVLTAKTTDPSKYIEYTYKIKPDSYNVDYNLALVGLQDVVKGEDLTLNWGLKSLATEKLALGKSTNQSRMSSVFYKPKGLGREYLSEMMPDARTLENKTEWVAFKHCYFSSIIMQEEGFLKNSFVGSRPIMGNKYSDIYVANLDISRTINSRTDIPLSYYFGPNDYDILAAQEKELEDIIDYGWGVFRVVNKFLIRPIFNFFNGFGLGLGIIILLVTICVRLIVLPLTYKNYKSSAKMKVLKPEIAEINEKYKGGDAMKKQQETMALYRKTGVNPMAGCLPMFIQMPILIAVFRFFPASLELRQESFLWAEDLSSYESIVDLPFTIPAYGSHVSLFTLLLCISTIFYTRMNSSQMSMPTQQGAPNMKMIMYLMPVMMLFFLNSYASGLTFYYFCGNLLTMGLMLLVKKYMIDENKLRAQIEENKKKPKQKSKFQQRMDQMVKQQQAKQQARKK